MQPVGGDNTAGIFLLISADTPEGRQCLKEIADHYTGIGTAIRKYLSVAPQRATGRTFTAPATNGQGKTINVVPFDKK